MMGSNESQAGDYIESGVIDYNPTDPQPQVSSDWNGQFDYYKQHS